MTAQASIEKFILEDLLQGENRKSIGLEEPLVSTGIIDSLAILRLIMFLEQDLGVKIGDGEVVLENFETLRQIVSFVEKKKSESPS
jgi:acyl carrier protein